MPRSSIIKAGREMSHAVSSNSALRPRVLVQIPPPDFSCLPVLRFVATPRSPPCLTSIVTSNWISRMSCWGPNAVPLSLEMRWACFPSCAFLTPSSWWARTESSGSCPCTTHLFDERNAVSCSYLRWISQDPFHFGTQSRCTLGSPSLLPIWILWAPLRWPRFCVR